jgi:SPP1 family predicted phage head-tail adaptor
MNTGAGQLRDKVTIQVASDHTRDEFGGATPVWETLDRVYAKISPLAARELETARSFAATVTHAIRIYFRDDVTTTQRIVLGSRTFAINGAVDPDQRRQYLDLYATELVT